MSVNQGQTKVEGLGQSNQSVIDCRVAVRVKLTHNLADNSLRLNVTAIGTKSHLVHLEKDAALNGLQTVTCVRKSSCVDDRNGVFKEGPPHFCRDIDFCDVLISIGEVELFVLRSHGSILYEIGVKPPSTRRS